MEDYANKMETTDELCKCRRLIPAISSPSVMSQVPSVDSAEGKPSLPQLSKTQESSKDEKSSKEEMKERNFQVKVKKLDAPTFDGDVRSYPSFKRDYERHMIPSY